MKPPQKYRPRMIRGLQANPRRAKAIAERKASARAWRKRERQSARREIVVAVETEV